MRLNIEYIKRLAKKKVRSEHGITHCQALDQLAKENGFPNWKSLQQAQKNKK